MGDLDKAECRRPIDSLGPSLDRQLQEDALCMRFNSLRSDTQLASDPLVGEPVAHEANDHPFANREGTACIFIPSNSLAGMLPISSENTAKLCSVEVIMKTRSRGHCWTANTA
jgi:hypothetical protein